MLKYECTLVTFTEVPDEISLCFNISNCPCRCQGCFEPWLRNDIGSKLTLAAVEAELKAHPHITCICFMGGDADHLYLYTLIQALKPLYPTLKFAMYSGFEEADEILQKVLDYYKVGPYIPHCGPLNCPTTNQHFWIKNADGIWEDHTSYFQQKKAQSFFLFLSY